MADYQSIFQPYYFNGWENQPSENTPIMGESLDAYDEALQSIERFLSSRLPLSVGYSVYSFLYGNGTLRISLLDRYGSELNHNDVSLGGMLTDLSFADGILTATYKSGDTKDVDITSLLDMIVPDITTTDSTTQPNSHAGREMVLEIGGVMEQDSTTGNQLFDKSTAIQSSRIRTTDGEAEGATNQSASDYIEVAENTSYTFNFSYYSSGDYGMAFYNAEKAFISGAKQGSQSGLIPFTFTTQSGCKYIRFSTTASVSVDEVMLNIGTTSLPLEQYTGGQPAPNPSYPMPIKNSKVKGVRTHHKNFLNVELVDGTTAGITFKLNADKSITVSGTITGSSYRLVGGAYLKPGNYIYGIAKGSFENMQSSITKPNGTSTTHSFPHPLEVTKENEGWYEFCLKGIETNVACSGTAYLQVEEGEVITEYEPYTSSEYTFSQPIDLYGKDGLQDVIEGGKVVGKFIEKTYDGSENWKKSSTYDNRYYLQVTSNGVAHGAGICTQFTVIQNETRVLNTALFSSDVVGRFVVNAEFATLEEWTAHLQANPMTVVYELAEETTEELPIADQIGLNSLLTYDGITYVEFIYDELEPTFRGKYGTSEVGGMTLESLLTAKNNELKQELANERLSALEASVVNNI